jgi:site-specific recombinase XerD
MEHPESIWTEPSNAQYPISVLREAYRDHLAGCTKPASPATIRKYDNTLESLSRSLVLHGLPLVLASITPLAIERWVADCRKGLIPRIDERNRMKLSEDSIASNLASVKAFTRKFVWKHLQMTTHDLLERVERYDPDPPMKPGLNEEQLEKIIGCYSDDPYEDIRDRAMIAFYASSGLRFDEVVKLTIDDVDPYSGWVKTLGKGNKERIVRITERARKYLRSYLHRRKERRGCRSLWTTDEGKPLSYFGGQTVFRRLKKRSGVKIAHAHRFRHTWTRTALKKKAERALVQDAMGWSSDAMVRRHGGWVRSETPAAAMPEFAPL